MSNTYLKGFKEFSTYPSLNEMASELTKLGVPKNMMQFIHKLGGQLNKMAYYGDTQIDPKTGKETSTFHTRKEPYKAKGGPWPEREDIPLSHDISVQGTKTGKKNIYHYLANILDSRQDTGLRLILVNPNQDQVHYITRKTGKMSKQQLAAAGISDTEEARTKGISQKRGLYVRVITVDGDSGNPIAAWEGTIGQMAEDMDNDSVLYIMEPEDRVRTARKVRKDRTEVTEDSFIKYFIDNFTKIADDLTKKKSSKSREEFTKIMSELSPEDFADINNANTEIGGKLSKLTAEIKGDAIDPESLKPKLNNFLELAFKEGEYEQMDDGMNSDKASLTNMAEVHTMPTVASMFLQYIVLGKVYKKFHTDDPIKELGLEDLF